MAKAAVYDFNTGTTKRELFSKAVTDLIDAALVTPDEPSRSYLGASQIGDECSRRTFYEVTGTNGAPHDGKTKRIFERGNVYETLAAAWLKKAGFMLRTESLVPRRQMGFAVASGRFKGHIDGVVEEGPKLDGLEYPCIWENKAVGDKGFKSVAKDGVAKAYPRYADQIALYQLYMDNQAAALATFVNANTMEIHAEAVAFDPTRAQQASDKAVDLLRAIDANDPPARATGSADQFPCPWCRFKQTCWGG